MLIMYHTIHLLNFFFQCKLLQSTNSRPPCPFPQSQLPCDRIFRQFADFRIIKIKKFVMLCVRSIRRDQVNRARNADYAARTCERFVYSIVKITRLYDYQTWQTFSEKFTRCAKVCGLFLLLFCFRDADWLGRQTPIP